jgi:hypothetical protein
MIVLHFAFIKVHWFLLSSEYELGMVYSHHMSCKIFKSRISNRFYGKQNCWVEIRVRWKVCGMKNFQFSQHEFHFESWKSKIFELSVEESNLLWFEWSWCFLEWFEWKDHVWNIIIMHNKYEHLNSLHTICS